MWPIDHLRMCKRISNDDTNLIKPYIFGDFMNCADIDDITIWWDLQTTFIYRQFPDIAPMLLNSLFLVFIQMGLKLACCAFVLRFKSKLVINLTRVSIQDSKNGVMIISSSRCTCLYHFECLLVQLLFFVLSFTMVLN